MKMFAKLDENNIVMDIVTIDDEDVGNLDYPASEAMGISFLKNVFGESTKWREMSLDGSFRTHRGGPGFVYDSVRDAFYQQQPYNSWTLNEDSLEWESPVTEPTREQCAYTVTVDGTEETWHFEPLWDEDNLRWVTPDIDSLDNKYWDPSTSSWIVI